MSNPSRAAAAAAVLAFAVASVAFPAAPASAQPTQPATASTQPTGVPVRAVVLYSSGVGYFEHFGTVHGADTQTLPFKAAQINDILKSLVLQDLDGGQVSVVTYPSLDPLDKTLKSFQVDIAGNPPLAQLLTQLRGAKVTLDAGGSKLSGTILGVEKKQKAATSTPGGPPAIIETSVLTLVTGGTLRALELDSVTSIQLEDPELQEELTKALTAVAAARDQDKKPVTIGFAGQGDRRVRVGYVIETPVWKTSYRLLLDTPAAQQGGSTRSTTSPATTRPGDADGKIQGWAIVENQTDSDWNNVQLSLVSGRPISFVQDLYQPLYIPRPVVQNELYASLLPQLYEDALGRAPAQQQAQKMMQRLETRAGGGGARDETARRRQGLSGGIAGSAVTAAPSAAAGAEAAADAYFAAGEANFAKSIASAASANAIGELFQYTVPNVTLARQRSAMLPIVTDDVEVERLSIYNQAVLAKNPLNGARVKNTTGKHLLAGPVTVLEGSSYAGDARIDNLPPGQERLISYGVDLQLRVDATKNRQDSQLLAGKVVKGVLELTYKDIATQEYLAENRSDHPKTLIVEHPVRQGWKLTDTDKPAETTETLYRFRTRANPGQPAKLVVKEEFIRAQALAMLQADEPTLFHLSRQGGIAENIRAELTKAIELKRNLAETQRKIEETTQRLQKITEEQTRLRENMKTVDRNSTYYTRLLNKLNDQETQIEKLQTELDDHRTQMEKRRTDLETYLANLNVG